MKTSLILIDAIQEMPGSFVIVRKDLSVVSHSKEWDVDLISTFAGTEERDADLRYRFEKAFQTTINGENSYVIQDLPERQTRFKYKLSRISTDPVLLVIQQVLLTRPKDYRKEMLLLETNKVADIGYWEYTISTGSIFWSEVTRKIHDVPPDFIPNLENSLRYYKEGESRARMVEAVEKCIETGEPYDKDFTVITHSGEEIYVNARGKAEFEDGKCVRLLGTFQDITERVARDVQLKKSEEQFRLAFEYSPIGFLILDVEDLRILRSNDAFNTLMCYSEMKIIGKKLTDFFIPEEADLYYLKFQQLLDGSLTSIESECCFSNKQGKKLLCSIFASVIYGRFNKPKEIIVQIQDVTELKRKNEEVNRFVEVTTKQNKRLLNFAHIVSHNLRSHASNIAMLLGFLKVEDNIEERNAQFDMLHRASKMLSETIDHLNEVVSVDIDSRQRKQVSLNHYIANTENALKGFLVDSNFTIYNNVPNDFQVCVIPAYLESILLNLFSNAIKYRDPAKKSWLQIKAEKKLGHSVIYVSDNGLGIDMERYGTRIFGLYKTFHDHSEARGLGLYMTQSQIQAMGGSIDVMSKVGEGTTFIIKLYEKN